MDRRLRAHRKGFGWHHAVLISLVAGTSFFPATAEHVEEDERPFSPSVQIGATPSLADGLTNLSISMQQPDLTRPSLLHRIELPAGFRFAVGSVDRARHPDGTPVETCGEISDISSATSRMEAIGYFSVGVQTDNTRDQSTHVHSSLTSESDGPVDGPAGSNVPETSEPGPALFGRPNNGDGVLFFHEWDSDQKKAVICGYAVSVSARIPPNHRDLAVLLELALRPDGSWLLSYDFDAVPGDRPFEPENPRSITDHPYFHDQNASIISTFFTFQGHSAGNFQSDPAGGPCQTFCPVAFVRNPQTAGDYTATAEIGPCRPSSSCAVDPARFESIISIRNAPVAYRHAAGELTGPITGQVPAGYSLILGDSVTFTWWPADTHPAERVKGYILAIAEPARPETIHYEYMVTNPTIEGFDPRQLCGPDGAAEECSLTLQFPLSTVGETPLQGDRRYDAALITVYEDGHRTDGLCDVGPSEPAGQPCPSTDPSFVVEEPGVSTWQIVARQEHWPVAFMTILGFTRTGGGPTNIAPDRVLLVDFDRRRAEYFAWNPLGVREDSFAAASNTIVGTNEGGGTVVFQSATMMGHTVNWRFDGIAFPDATVPCGIAIVGSCGTFTRYDLKGAPGAIPPGGTPTARPELFAGKRVL